MSACGVQSLLKKSRSRICLLFLGCNCVSAVVFDFFYKRKEKDSQDCGFYLIIGAFLMIIIIFGYFIGSEVPCLTGFTKHFQFPLFHQTNLIVK